MKQLSLTLAVFLFFIAILSSVKFLETYSNQYRLCADAWMSEAAQIETRPQSAPRFLKRLDQGFLTVNGQECPVLAPMHRNNIKNRIKRVN